MSPDRIESPDGKFYLSEEHGYWLPVGSTPPADPGDETKTPSLPAGHTDKPEEGAAGPRRSKPLVPRLFAVVICGGLAWLILLLTDQAVPKPLGEALAVVPILFVDYAAEALASRKFVPPKSFGDIIGARSWYLSALAYAALLLIVADIEGAVLALAGSTTLVLGLLNIADGIALGVLIGWRSPPRPVLTILGASYGAALIGGLFDLLLLGQHRFTQVHHGAALITVVAVSGTVFAVTGLLGYLGWRSWRRHRPPRLLLSPDGQYVWDGARWQQVGPDGRSYQENGTWVPFTPRKH